MAAFAWFNAAPSHVRGGGLYPSRCERCVHTIRSALTVQEVGTVAIAGQKTGTSGLRKKTRILLDQPNYVCNWIQSLFNAIGLEELKGQTLILGGDGRFYNREAAQMMIRLAAGNGLGRVIVGQNALMTTPAVSAAIIRRRTLGGIIMTASHNPAGIDGDWGIKYNVANGSPATETLLDRVYENTITIKRYFLADLGGDVDVTTLGERIYGNGDFVVEVIDPAIDHILTLRECFDFEKLSNFIARRDFTFRFDAMHAASGPSARSVFVGELGASEDTMLNDQPLEDFGGGHPDPNLTYAKELVELLDPQYNPKAPDFGAASDGDGDRNMIVGQGFFVTPSDSLAVIADYAVRAIAHFRDGLKGVARSMPTSGAIDRIAARNGLELYETPTGWKYFGNLMDSGRISLCGEESFGTGSDHIREKDGIWAVLAWLSILSYRNENTPIGGLVTVEQIVREHWHKYGRNFYARYDYENVSSADAESMMAYLRKVSKQTDQICLSQGYELHFIDEFSYADPVDNSIAMQQGVRILFTNGSRIIVRLSGTGASGATIRIYIEEYTSDVEKQSIDAAQALQELVNLALEITRIQHFTGRATPSVIT